MFTKKKGVVSVFDIENGRVRFAQMDVDDSQKLLRVLAVFSVNDLSLPTLSKVIRAIDAAHKVHGTQVILNMPRHQVTARNIKLPSTNPSEIDGMVNLQAAKLLPFPQEQIISTYIILGRDDAGYSDVMMALMQRDSVDKVLAVFGQAGIIIDSIVLSSEGIYRWYLSKYGTEEGNQAVCVVEIGMTFFEMQIIRGGRPEFTRALGFASSDEMDGRLDEEIRRSLSTYRKNNPGFPVQKLIILGRRSAVEKEAPRLRADLGLPMVYSDILKQYPRSQDAILPGGAEFMRDSFASLLFIGFNHESMKTNFLPRELRTARLSRSTKDSLVMTACLLIAILAGLIGIVVRDFIVKSNYLSSITAELKQIEPKVKKLAQVNKITTLIKRQIDQKGSSIDVLREMFDRVPESITINIFDFVDKQSCLVRGSSRQLSEVFKFVSSLEESDYFDDVKVRYATKRMVGKDETTDFEIVCRLAGKGPK